MNSYHKHYQQKWAVNDAGLDQLINEDSFWARWDKKSDLPSVCVTNELSIGLVCLYAGDWERGAIFLDRTIRNAHRLEAEDRFHDTEVAEAGYPLSHAEVIRARALARWLLDEPLTRADPWFAAKMTPVSGITHDFSKFNRADFRKAAEMYVAWCLTKAEDRKRFVSSYTMSIYLQGVRCAMIANELDYAGELLGTKQRLRWHHGTERELWTCLATTYPAMKLKLREDVASFFDRVRDPDFKEVLDGLPTSVDREALALDTGIIRQMYFVNTSPLDPVDPNAVIDAVGY